MNRKPYPSDLSEEEWAFVAPYLTLMKENALQRQHSLREVFNALRWLARAGAPWRMLPNDFPPWQAVYQPFRRWVVERRFGWVARFRRLARDFERMPHVLAALHFIVFTVLMPPKVVATLAAAAQSA